MNFFVLRGRPEDATLLHITMDKPAQDQLGQWLQPLVQAVIAGERVTFDPGYKADEGEIVVISPYELPAPLAVLSDPAAVAALPPLVGHELGEPGIRALVAAEWAGSKLRFLAIQRLDARYILKSEGWRLMFAKGRFVRDARPGLEVSDRVDAVILDDRLLVASWARAHAALDLSAWTREATLSEAQAFVTQSVFVCERGFDIEGLADAWTRRKIGSIRASGILERCKPAALKEYASQFGVVLRVSKGKAVLPADKKEFKAVLSLLDEDLLAFEPTNEHWVVNSKRRAAGA